MVGNFHKMTVTQSYTIDIIKLVPDDSICYIQAPSNDNSQFLNLMKPSQFEYYLQIVLTPANKELLTKVIANDNVEEYFQSIEIRHNNQLLFEGYDGMEYGTVSKNLKLPVEFIEKYIGEEMYIVSKEW